MVGDIMMGTTYPDTLLPYKDGAFLFKDSKGVLRSADLAVGNHEGTLCDGGRTAHREGRGFRRWTSGGGERDELRVRPFQMLSGGG